MITLFWSSALFVLAFFIHLVLWKVRLPKRQTKAILQIFFATLFVGIFILWNLPNDPIVWKIPPPVHLREYIHISLFFISLTLAYVISYSALEADSPSLVIVAYIANAGSNGLDKKCFDELMNDNILIKPRIRDLLLNNMVERDGEKYVLTAKGILFVRIFIIYRKIMNVPHKGG